MRNKDFDDKKPTYLFEVFERIFYIVAFALGVMTIFAKIAEVFGWMIF